MCYVRVLSRCALGNNVSVKLVNKYRKHGFSYILQSYFSVDLFSDSMLGGHYVVGNIGAIMSKYTIPRLVITTCLHPGQAIYSFMCIYQEADYV